MEIITRKEAMEQGLKRYYTGKPCKYGHVSERSVSDCWCCACASEYQLAYREANKEKIAEKDREYREANKEKITERMKKYREANKEKLSERKKKYREANKEKITESQKKYREANKEEIKKYYEVNKKKLSERKKKYREANREKIKKYYKANPLPLFIRNSLNRIFNNWKGGRAKAEEIHGYTLQDLRRHIESRFKDGMSWDNRSDWHIDHIKPISAFIKEGITDPAIINALDNLQPLWANENLSKGARY